MNTAIEILEWQLKLHSEIVGGAVHEATEPRYIIDKAIRDCEELQTAINHLKRKVKKNPRVDGLPESRKKLLLWKKGEDIPLGGYYNFSKDKWIVFTSAKPYATDEILFYADPNEII